MNGKVIYKGVGVVFHDTSAERQNSIFFKKCQRCAVAEIKHRFVHSVVHFIYSSDQSSLKDFDQRERVPTMSKYTMAAKKRHKTSIGASRMNLNVE